MARLTQEEKEQLVADAEEAFLARLERIANDPDEYRTWVESVAAFGARYSVGNQGLLEEQCMLRGVEPQFFLPFGGKDGRTGWLGQHRQVRKGEAAFWIWAPVTKRPTDEQAAAMEAQGRKVRRDPDGRPSIQLVGFRFASTFELSQTDPAEGYEDVEFVVPTVEVLRRQKLIGGKDVKLLTGEDPTGAYDEIIKLIEGHGYTYSLAPAGTRYLGTANGVTVTGAKIRQVMVADHLEPAQRIKTAIHELAHIRCEHAEGTRIGVDLHRGRKETEAESVAHIVCLALGLDSSPYTDAYVLGWANGDLDLIREAMEMVQKVSKAILSDLTPADAEDVEVAA